MPYLDYTDEWLRDLTRQRRLEREIAKTRPVVVRFSASGDEFTPSIACSPSTLRSKARVKAWRRAQWRAGNRRCTYCNVGLLNIAHKLLKGRPVDLRCVTVDHKEPVVLGGDDAAWNYAMCCFGCNNRKGSMTEAEFRALLACEVLAKTG